MDPSAHDLRESDARIADECRLNVLWLNGGAPGERALEIVVPGLGLTEALRATHRTVEQHSGLAMSRNGLPYSEAAFDLVTLYGRVAEPAELSECRRVLRPGGVALFAAENSGWVGRGLACRRTHAALSLRFAARIRSAGFREVRPYWVEPSLAVPRNQIPALPARVRIFEAARARETGAGLPRSVAVKAGLHQLLYPAVLFVAVV